MTRTRKPIRPTRPPREGPIRVEQRSPRRGYGRWRALSLLLVYVLFAAHIVHWKISGKTLAPLELNEVMYTLELGIITAGFLFMCLLVLGTAVFGRFFCSWACHIIALQDLCAWLLRKLGLAAKPIRSRLLLLVPPLTAFYMFLWPQIVRAWQARSLPTFHLATDRGGWASFVTENFWRNLPGPWVIAATFLICGFVMVYLLGSRTFCTYVCPYGAVFALADRVAAGRIRLTGECQQCGSCTAACTSAVRVHEEIGRFGMVVNPACLKDLDCVGACPHEVLGYGFGRPAMLKSDRGGGRFGLSYGFSMGEELMMAGVFMVCLLTFRGLYGRVPFLLSLAVGAIIAYGSVVTLRVLRRPSVRMGRRDLKRYGRLATGGYVYLAAATLVFVFVGHSAVVRYYEYTGLRQSLALQRVSDENQRLARAGVAHDRLLAADRWGLLANPHVARGLVITSSQLDRPEETVVFANRYLERVPGDSWVGLKLGQALLALDRPAEAERRFVAIVSSFQDNLVAAPRHVATAYQSLAQVMFGRGDSSAAVVELRRALAIAPEDAALHAELGSMLAEAGDFDGAIEQLREAIRREPELGKARYNLGTLLAHTGRTAEAVIEYRAALDHLPDDADLHNNLGFALMRVGETEAARREFVAVLGLNPDHAGAHFNLARLLFAAGDVAEAERHLQTAARLDPRFGG